MTRISRPIAGAVALASCLAMVPAIAQDQKPPAAPPPQAPADPPKPPADSGNKDDEAAEAQGEFLTKDFLRRNRMRLDWNPVGATLPGPRFRFGNFIPMHPVGFRGDVYDTYLTPTYSFGTGWEVSAGAVGANRIGPIGEAVFWGLGVQRELITETKSRPAVSLAGFGMTGPDDHHSGSVILSASKKLWGDNRSGAFLHGGARLGVFSSENFGSGTGVRPWVGASVVFSRRLILTGEYSPEQPWEDASMYSARLSYLIYKRVGISGGIRNNGYDTAPFIGILF